jgi:hypothetical protein
MITHDHDNESLADDEVLVYLGPPDDEDEDVDAFRQDRKSAAERSLAKVAITDDELERLRRQVQRIASKLEPGGADKDDRFAVDSVTLHVGVSASGHFFFIANAGIEAAVDITWRRPQ